LKLAHVKVPAVSNAKDLSRIDRAICDSTIFESECAIDSDCPKIRKGMKFNSLPELQFFLADYAVRHHWPFYGSFRQEGTLRCAMQAGMPLGCLGTYR